VDRSLPNGKKSRSIVKGNLLIQLWQTQTYPEDLLCKLASRFFWQAGQILRPDLPERGTA